MKIETTPHIKLEDIDFLWLPVVLSGCSPEIVESAILSQKDIRDMRKKIQVLVEEAFEMGRKFENPTIFKKLPFDAEIPKLLEVESHSKNWELYKKINDLSGAPIYESTIGGKPPLPIFFTGNSPCVTGSSYDPTLDYKFDSITGEGKLCKIEVARTGVVGGEFYPIFDYYFGRDKISEEKFNLMNECGYKFNPTFTYSVMGTGIGDMHTSYRSGEKSISEEDARLIEKNNPDIKFIDEMKVVNRDFYFYGKIDKHF